MPKTKSFRVAVEGATVDGRVIERSWLSDIAATYNRQTYAARVNMEHIRGITADKPFKAYGDVLSVSTAEVDIELGGKTEKKLALFCEIEATDELVAMNRDKQKLYTSIEVQPNFAGTNKAYLVGLAVTDSPASLGTEMLTFAVKNPGVMRHGPQPQVAGNVFSLGHETRFELADGTQGDPVIVSDEAKGFFSAASAFFNKLTAAPVAPTPPPPPPPPAGDPAPAANDNDQKFTAIASGIAELTKGIEAIGTRFATEIGAVRTEIATVKASIENTPAPNQPKRGPATGGTGAFTTDC